MLTHEVRGCFRPYGRTKKIRSCSIYSKIQSALTSVYWTTPSGNHLQKQISSVTKREIYIGARWEKGSVQLDFLLGILDRVGAVADISSNSEGVVTADGARERSKGVGGTEDGAASLDGIQTLPNSGDNRASAHVL